METNSEMKISFIVVDTAMTWTLLHDACEHRDARTILQLAADNPADTDAHGSTPLHVFLSQSGPIDDKVLKALLMASPESVTSQDYHGNTPLHVVCCFEETTKHVVQMLLDVDPRAAKIPNREGLWPLHMACRHAPNNEQVIGLLIDAAPEALRTHIKMGDRPPSPTSDAPLNPIVDHNAGMTSKDLTDLRFESIQRQVRDGAYPIHMALEAGACLAVIELLIKGAPEYLLETNKFGETPLHVAIRRHASEDVIRVLLAHGKYALEFREDRYGNMPIHVAACVGCSVHVAKDILELWPSMIHQMNYYEKSPIDLAIEGGKCSPEVMELLCLTDQNADED